MADDLDPLPDDLRSAFDAERRRSGVDDAMRARLLGRVLGSVAVGAAIGTAAGTAGAAAGAGAGGAAGAGTGAATGAVAGAGGVAFAKMAPWLLGAFLIGGGVGAAVHAAVVAKDAPITPPSAIPSPSPSARPDPGPNTAPSDSVAAISVSALPSASTRVVPAITLAPSTRPSSTASADPVAQRDVDLAAERALVDRARTALTRGQPAAALEALDSHAKSFPRGRLTEEREALAIDALARAGRTQEAATRADRFRSTWPNSVFGGLVDTASPKR